MVARDKHSLYLEDPEMGKTEADPNRHKMLTVLMGVFVRQGELCFNVFIISSLLLTYVHCFRLLFRPSLAHRLYHRQNDTNKGLVL